MHCSVLYPSISILYQQQTAGDGESALLVSAFYGWLDWVKHLVETVGLDPEGMHMLLIIISRNVSPLTPRPASLLV